MGLEKKVSAESGGEETALTILPGTEYSASTEFFNGVKRALHIMPLSNIQEDCNTSSHPMKEEIRNYRFLGLCAARVVMASPLVYGMMKGYALGYDSLAVYLLYIGSASLDILNLVADPRSNPTKPKQLEAQ